MAVRLLLLSLTVWSCALAYYLPGRWSSSSSSSSVPCLQALPGAKCWCGDALDGASQQVFCACQVKTLDLRNLSQDYRFTRAASFHLKDCGSTSVLVFPQAFSHLKRLQTISFFNVSRLTLEPFSVNLDSEVEDAFNISFSLITNLNMRKNAVNVRLRHHKAGMNLKIERANLINLMKSAIVGKLREVTMKEVLVKVRPWPEAIVCQGLTGASLIMKSVLIKRGLSGRWIIGNISSLSISKSYLRLLPDAFAGVNKEIGIKSKTRIVLLDNTFMMPSLPSHALPSYGHISRAKRNHIVCRCPNLAWLLEAPSTLVKQNFKASLVCHNDKNVTSVLASCDAPCTPNDCKQNP